MNYTCMQFGKELKGKLLLEKDVAKIADWTYIIYLEHEEVLESGLKNILLRLVKMEKGPEFAISHEILNKIADDLITNKVIDLKAEGYCKETRLTKDKYIQAMFGFELQKRILQKQNVVDIGIWSHSYYFEYCEHIQSMMLRQVMLDLNAMECGPEFAISYEMLNKIADDLIAGKYIDLNAKEYREKEI